MRRPNDQLFRKTEFNRLVDAARRKGLSIAGIEVTRDGLKLIVGEPSNDNGKNESKTDVENWIAKHENQN
jgi:hypothetical protein